MATTVVNHTYKLKRGKEDAVNRANPLLLAGEPIVVYCNDGKTRLKIGDGKHYYSELLFIGGTGSGGSDIAVDNKLSLDSTNPVMNKVITNELYNKVDKVPGKDLSTNDFSDAERAKLENIEEGATRVLIDTTHLDATSGNAISNSLVTQALNVVDTKVTQIEESIEEVVEEKVSQVVEEVVQEMSLDGGEI